jgi:DNA-binding NtrC family response regulator
MGTAEAPRVLVVEDDAAMREVIAMRLQSWGYEVQGAGSAAEAEGKLADFEPHAVISDVILPGASGLELLKVLKRGDPHRPVILVTSDGRVDLAVEAMKQGATDFLTKPLAWEQLQAILEAIERERAARDTRRRLASVLDQEDGRFGALVGASEPMREVYGLIRQVAVTDASILITGESGTGKELVARTIHELSARATGPFVAINAAAIPEDLMESEIFGHEKGSFTGATGMRRGCFEEADRGTLFLDEIAEMPVALQPKLLRVLEDGRVRRVGGSREIQCNVRVLAATNRSPQEAMREGRLREDLYYRLGVFTVDLPPLRQRRSDMPLLVQHFVGEFGSKHGSPARGTSADAMKIMEQYPWPGNVRELRNVVERAVVLTHDEWIEPAHLPPYLRQPGGGAPGDYAFPPGSTLAEAEKALILRTLEETGHNKAEAARRLGIAARTIYNKLKSYGLE